MRAVKSRNTRPERLVRQFVRDLGQTYRLHAATLPGKPDLVFPKPRKAIFVHGCFWHQHTCKRGNRRPATNRSYWLAKLARNVSRDRTNARLLRRLGWKVLIVWECQIGTTARQRIRGFLMR